MEQLTSLVMLHLNAFSVLGVSDDVRKSRVCTMFANRLRGSDNRDNSASLWFTGLLAAGSVASVYYLYRSRRNAPHSQQATRCYPSPTASGQCRRQFLVVVDGASAWTLKVCRCFARSDRNFDVNCGCMAQEVHCALSDFDVEAVWAVTHEKIEV